MEYLRDLFGALCSDRAEVEARCLLVMTLFVGRPLVSVDHCGARRADVLKRAEALLLT